MPTRAPYPASRRAAPRIVTPSGQQMQELPQVNYQMVAGIEQQAEMIGGQLLEIIQASDPDTLQYECLRQVLGDMLESVQHCLDAMTPPPEDQ